jgi:thiamine pyrophosphokinase
MQYAIPKYVILLGGDLFLQPHLVDYCKNAFVIAADSGIAHAEKIQTKVDLWIGDFDSASPTLLSQYHHVPRQTFPVEKDKTDGELAINYAIAHGATHILCVGALGGARCDHTLQHFMHAFALKQQGVHLTLTDGHQLARALLPGETYSA